MAFGPMEQGDMAQKNRSIPDLVDPIKRERIAAFLI